MNALEFIPFIGYSSIYPPLDDLLNKNGIKWRPNVKRRLDTTYFAPGQGVVLSFTIGADSDRIIKKSDGDFILEHITMTMIEEDKKHGAYNGPLPHGLNKIDSRQHTREKLGTPTRTINNLDNYYIDQLVWTAAFQGDSLRSLELSIPSEGWRKHGLCP